MTDVTEFDVSLFLLLAALAACSDCSLHLNFNSGGLTACSVLSDKLQGQGKYFFVSRNIEVRIEQESICRFVINNASLH